MMDLVEHLYHSILPGKILDIRVGLFRSAVLVETVHGIQCGMAATLISPQQERDKQTGIRQAGNLHTFKSQELADLVHSDQATEASIGLAAINALLPPLPDGYSFVEENAEEYIVRTGKNKQVAVIGHFPFVNRLPAYVKKQWCLELKPREGDLPASFAPEILPQADLVVITATTLINRTLDRLLPLCKKDAEVILLGPTTPLAPILFESGIHILSGIIVTDPMNVLLGISQGATLNQLHQMGWISYVNVRKEH